MEENSESSKRLAAQLKDCKQEVRELRHQLYVRDVQEGIRQALKGVEKRKTHKYTRWLLTIFALAGVREIASWIFDLIAG